MSLVVTLIKKKKVGKTRVLEEAKELVRMFILSADKNKRHYVTGEEAKQCALICLKEKIGILEEVHLSTAGDGYWVIDKEILNLKKVKLEIDNL